MEKELKAIKKSDIALGQSITVDVEGKKVAVFNIDGEYFAIDNVCTHRGGSLSNGELDKNVVTCPLHSAKFDVKTGKVLGGPAKNDVHSYKIRVDGECIKIEA